ncbi:synaptotagmin-like protein 3 isoform X1 [Nerophis ophidion]|uniref:synaptotagmin-like protein 3 isoform X1 n=2 Tax=Nerophis ophidion TaxID=159077 RepID=UPI002ADFA0E6|nr:synaptotagmin-like protein 3 isoform X1 [Nerophis ophidion]XP_061741986.1 synaptotagmin-like protein 3 isoform X1 [Nerophis ophidion]
MDLGLLQGQERDRILEVLRRDKLLRKIEEDRIRRMKFELQELRRRGAKSCSKEYGKRTCARCQRPLGKWCNTGEVCRGCSHRICNRCRMNTGAAGWKCTVCYADREVKIRSGEWFLDQKTKKYPTVKDKYETVGEKLLKTYSMLSHISIVPATPPPHSDFHFLSRSGDENEGSVFPRSVEDFMFSISSNIKKISKSQNDVRGDLLNVDGGKPLHYSTQKSLSDTNVSTCVKLYQGLSLQNLFKKSKDSDPECSSAGTEEESSRSSDNSDGKQESIPIECGDFEGITCKNGELELAMAYNSTTSCLEITVGAGRDLPYGDTRKKRCHPYVKLQVMPPKGNKLKTSVKRNTTHPVYNQLFKYHIERHLLTGKRLQASVWHSGTLHRKVFLGEVLIPLDGWQLEGQDIQRFNWYPLCPRQRECPEGGAVDLNGGELLHRIQSSFNRRSSLDPRSTKRRGSRT